MIINVSEYAGKSIDIVFGFDGVHAFKKIRENELQGTVGGDLGGESTLFVILNDQQKQVIGSGYIHLATAFERKSFKEVLRKKIGDDMDKIMSHMVVASAGKNGESRDKVEVSFFERQSAVYEIELCCSGADVIDADITEAFDHILPIGANVQKCGCFDIQLCREKKVVEIFHEKPLVAFCKTYRKVDIIVYASGKFVKGGIGQDVGFLQFYIGFLYVQGGVVCDKIMP